MSAIEEFSGFEVIKAAMEVERNGHAFYTAMAAKAQSQMAKDVFSWLAQDEVGHLKTLQDLAPRYEEGGFWDDEEVFLPYLQRFNEKELFPSGARLQAVLAEADVDLKALDLAIEAERNFAEYFHKAAAHARTKDGKEAFAWLAGEEDRHAEVLMERRQRLQAL